MKYAACEGAIGALIEVLASEIKDTHEEAAREARFLANKHQKVYRVISIDESAVFFPQNMALVCHGDEAGEAPQGKFGSGRPWVAHERARGDLPKLKLVEGDSGVRCAACGGIVMAQVVAGKVLCIGCSTYYEIELGVVKVKKP